MRTPPPNRKEGLLITHDTGVRYALIAIGNLALQADFCEPFVDLGTTGDCTVAVFEHLLQYYYGNIKVLTKFNVFARHLALYALGFHCVCDFRVDGLAAQSSCLRCCAT